MRDNNLIWLTSDLRTLTQRLEYRAKKDLSKETVDQMLSILDAIKKCEQEVRELVEAAR